MSSLRTNFNDQKILFKIFFFFNFKMIQVKDSRYKYFLSHCLTIFHWIYLFLNKLYKIGTILASFSALYLQISRTQIRSTDVVSLGWFKSFHLILTRKEDSFFSWNTFLFYLGSSVPGEKMKKIYVHYKIYIFSYHVFRIK